MKIVVPNPVNPLQREVWNLVEDSGRELGLRVETYSLERRESARHRTWKRVRHWDRLFRRECTIPATEVPRPPASYLVDAIYKHLSQYRLRDAAGEEIPVPWASLGLLLTR